MRLKSQKKEGLSPPCHCRLAQVPGSCTMGTLCLPKSGAYAEHVLEIIKESQYIWSQVLRLLRIPDEDVGVYQIAHSPNRD